MAVGKIFAHTKELAEYLKEVNKYKVLTILEEKNVYDEIIDILKNKNKVILKIQNTNISDIETIKGLNAELKTLERLERKTKDILVNTNLRYVVRMAKIHAGNASVYDLMDLIQEGHLGLIHATNVFDYEGYYSHRFMTYATYHVRVFIINGIQKYGYQIRVPADVHVAKQKYSKVPLKEELTYEDYENLTRVESSFKPTVSLYSQLGDEYELIDTVRSDEFPDTDHNMDNDTILVQDLFSKMGDVLDRREIDILKKYYGIDLYTPCSFEEIADEYDLTKERVRQIKEKAIMKLRDCIYDLHNLYH